MNDIFAALVTSFAVNAGFFVLAATRKTDVVTDLSYGLSFALTATILALKGGVDDPLRLAGAGFVLIWALRLVSYLFRRIILIKVDHRFDGRREKPLVFARFWTLQALTTVIVMLPVIALLGNGAPRFSFLHVAGALVWLAGFLMESVADAQKWNWKRAGHKGFMRTGLWSWSRHPNYFGEMLVWWGIWLYALPSLSGAWHLAVIGPAFISILLLFVSGIPLLEKSADARFGGDSAYEAYKKYTSILFPLPPHPSGTKG